ncbi:hypothetical protein H8M03_08260 [Sphingomonas sabuli]|uniref:Uncharacterized protein n=1 Tax=Sphingomonas sabuli TaxID=2764186 RepID=A0A7G9L077_9SPHN|nr:hypothetical protein [Sphingomonas sabuli]QNM82026.1 hypothetical protein H8M03_08260 [Sphingomonas sabuli]
MSKPSQRLPRPEPRAAAAPPAAAAPLTAPIAEDYDEAVAAWHFHLDAGHFARRPGS